MLAVTLIFGGGIVTVGGLTVHAQVPVIPHTFFGFVTINGADAVDLPVQARIDNVDYAAGTPQTASDGTYGVETVFRVCGDTPGLLGKQGGIDDEQIDFFVFFNETWYFAQTHIFESGATTRLDLTASTDAEPAGDPTPSDDACSDGQNPPPTPPVLPQAFFGQVTIDDGETSADGVRVQARLLTDNVSYTSGQPQTDSNGTYGVSTDFRVCGDTPGAAGRQGGINGDTFGFYVEVDNQWFLSQIDSVSYLPGGVTRLDLIVSTGDEPVGPPTQSATACKVGDEVPTPTPIPSGGGGSPGGQGGGGGGGGGAAPPRATETPTPEPTPTNIPTAIPPTNTPRPADPTATPFPSIEDSNELGAILRTLPLDEAARWIAELSVDVATSIAPTIFDIFPNVPADTLIPNIVPELEPGFDPPVAVQITDDLIVYTVPSTGEFVWVKLVGSPAPIDEILGKFNKVITDVQVAVESLPEAPVDAPDFRIGQKLKELFSIDIANVTSSDLMAGYATIYVEKSWIAENRIHPMGVQVSRLDETNNIWVPMPVQRVREEEERIFYSVAIPGFSIFAITGSTEAPVTPFEVTNLSVAPADLFEDEAIRVTANVTNTSDELAVYPANLWINSSLHDSEAIVLQAGETQTFSFELTLAEGEYELRIERLFETISVRLQQPSPTATATTEPTASATAAPTATPEPATPTFTAVPPSPTPSPSPTPTISFSEVVTATSTASATIEASSSPETVELTLPDEGGDAGGLNFGAIAAVAIGILMVVGGGIALVQVFRARA